MSQQRVSKIWADTIRQDVCKHRQCGKTIWFAMNARTGNFMPFAQQPSALVVERELETGREMWTVSLEFVHFADCPGADRFRRRG